MIFCSLPISPSLSSKARPIAGAIFEQPEQGGRRRHPAHELRRSIELDSEAPAGVHRLLFEHRHVAEAIVVVGYSLL